MMAEFCHLFFLQSVKRYIDRISKYQILNQQIFDVLYKALKTDESDTHTPVNVQLYKPPMHQSQVKNM